MNAPLLLVARGDAVSAPARPLVPVASSFSPVALLRSPLAGVSDVRWTIFVRGLETQPLGAVSESNGLGCFEMRPRRLGDLGLMTGLHSERLGKRTVWSGTFKKPLTRTRFLSSPLTQYRTLVQSMVAYDEDLRGAKMPLGMSRSGALAVLHRAGYGGLAGWGEKRFPETVALFRRTNGAF